jgi:hypothetical protein
VPIPRAALGDATLEAQNFALSKLTILIASAGQIGFA